MIQIATATVAETASLAPSIISAISTVGFPIVMCGAFFWYIQKENVANRDKIDKFSDALNGLTTVIAKLLERLDKE